MKSVTMVVFAATLLAGCYEKTPSNEQAIEIAKKEISMAMCGNKTESCIKQSVGNAKIGPRLNDHTNKINVTFSGIIQTDDSPSKAYLISGGIVNYTFDAKDGNSHVNEISLWSDDSKHSIELCGHDYKFCKK
ncbi:hypothetical protein NS303_21710 [Pantoea ananatis]|uniref:hypothetical protein n=1 Tax=Pantoea ananas TaxID=553 RepID=UPI000737918E|nr:hypothetical protein [Pantoea ananatis]KTR45543.1 hypothetical protein NS303_21710 [Pantoea ananatis]KTR54169.1 hypothetical protein NS311_17100 [Pantoea ananatis]KTR62530.1 hypothetical protein RSA47_20950 [Pantoea ananatis]KTR68098.1 hypothetical protein NS296_19990 [Pantoea ananatis]MCW0310164.1 hypothetical protein [Pantoea ananatis]